MKVTVVGLESVDYTSKKTGKPVSGVSIYVLRSPTSRQLTARGQIADSVYISCDSPLYHELPKFEFGKEYDFVYEYDGRFSFLSAVVPVE